MTGIEGPININISLNQKKIFSYYDYSTNCQLFNYYDYSVNYYTRKCSLKLTVTQRQDGATCKRISNATISYISAGYMGIADECFLGQGDLCVCTVQAMGMTLS